MGDIENIGKARADRSNDSRDWNPVDALRETLRRVEAGEIKPDLIYIAMACEGATPHHVDYRFQCAGGLRLDYLGLLTRFIHLTNTD